MEKAFDLLEHRSLVLLFLPGVVVVRTSSSGLEHCYVMEAAV